VKDDRLYLIHISECIDKIVKFTSGGREAFMASALTQDAVIRNFEVMGEAAKHLSEGFKAAHPESPWKQIAGFRDVLIHDYIGVDLDRIWSVIEKDLEGLHREVRRLME
jgi:uncharacterized protein with HEPN domain